MFIALGNIAITIMIQREMLASVGFVCLTCPAHWLELIVFPEGTTYFPARQGNQIDSLPGPISSLVFQRTHVQRFSSKCYFTVTVVFPRRRLVRQILSHTVGIKVLRIPLWIIFIKFLLNQILIYSTS